MAPTAPDARRDWFVDHLRADAERFASVVETSPLDTPIASCPGWNLGRLAEHLGFIHRWASICAAGGRPEKDDPESTPPDGDGRAIAHWSRARSAELVGVLEDLDPAAERWNPFPAAQDGSFWPRRQAQETALHLWDAVDATGASPTLDPELAADGIDEALTLGPRRRRDRDDAAMPPTVVRFRCVDTGDAWVLGPGPDGGPDVRRAERQSGAASVPDDVAAEVAGPAERILLALWERSSGVDVLVTGDATAAADWISVAAW